MEQDLCWLLELPPKKWELLSATIGLVRAAVEIGTADDATAALLIGALQAIDRGTEPEWVHWVSQLHREKQRLAPDCAACANPCGRTADYPMEEFSAENPAVQQQKAGLLGSILRSLRAAPPRDVEELYRWLFLFGYEKDAGELTAALGTV